MQGLLGSVYGAQRNAAFDPTSSQAILAAQANAAKAGAAQKTGMAQGAMGAINSAGGLGGIISGVKGLFGGFGGGAGTGDGTNYSAEDAYNNWGIPPDQLAEYYGLDMGGGASDWGTGADYGNQDYGMFA
jgi:hypothetical protein